MKFQKLTIKNLASIESAVIDFDAAPLAGAPLFLITGETGAGKSTILDAICLALYGKTPRLAVADSSEKATFGTDYITAANSANLLRHGTTDAFVELEFIGVDGIEYVARWEVGRTRNNTIRAAKTLLTIIDRNSKVSEQTLSGKVALKRVVEVAVGLDLDQFCRTTMLAQGQFTQFLKSKDKEKSDILEKITGTEIYSEIGQKISTITKDKEQAYQQQRLLSDGIELLSDEQIDSVKAQITAIEGEIAKLNSAIAEAQKCHDWLDKMQRLEMAVAQLAERHAVFKQETETEQFQEDNSIVAQWDMTEDARRAIKSVDAGQQKLAECDETAKKMHMRFDELVAGRNFAEREITLIDDEINQLQKLLSESEPYVAIYDNIREISEQLVRYEGMETLNKEYLNKKAECERQIISLQSQLVDAKKNVEQVSIQSQSKQAELDAKQAELATYDTKSIADELLKLSRRKNEIARLRESIAKCDMISEKLSSALKRYEEAMTRAESDIKQADALSPEIERDTEELKRQETLYSKMELSVNDWTAELRGKLSKGDVCPVCGTTIKSLLDDEACRSNLAPIEADIKSRREKLNDLLVQQNTLRQTAEKLQSEASKLSPEIQSLSHDHRQLIVTIDQQCAIVGITSYSNDIAGAISELDKADKLVDIKTVELTDVQHKASEVQAQLQKLNKDKSDLNAVEMKTRDEASRIESKLASTRENLSEIIRQIAETSASMESAINNLDQYLVIIENWRERLVDDAKQFTAQLNSESQLYFTRKEQLTSKRAEVELLKAKLQRTNQSIKSVELFWTDWVADTVAESHAVADVDAKWQTFAIEASNLAGEINLSKNEIHQQNELLQAFYSQNAQIDEKRLRLLLQIEDINEVRLRLQKILTGITESEGALKTKQAELLGHKAQRPQSIGDEDTIASVAERLTLLKQSLTTITEQIGGYRQQLKTNEDNRKRVADEKIKEERLYKEFLSWKSLNEEFGGMENPKFKKIAQGYVLNDLLKRANGYLSKLNKRYTMDCDMATLTIRMHDNYQGGEQGPVDILSGGESFMVSLSLALALSSINRHGMNIETLFIDEGFGTLSGECLHSVMLMLERMKGINGRSVGIISHVDALKERIPVQIHVNRIDDSRSGIKIVDTTMA